MATAELLLTAFRSDLGDPGGDVPDADRLWSDAEVLGYLDDAQYQVAKDTLQLADTYSLALVTDTAEYSVPDWLLRVRRAKRVSDGGELDVVNNDDRGTYLTDFDDYGVWRVRTLDEDSTGVPRLLTFDERTNKLRVIPKPATDDTVKLYVFRGPKTEVDDADCELELGGRRFRRALLLWMKKRAYEKHDADIRNEGYSTKYFQEYLAAVSQLQTELKLRQRRVGTVRYGGV